MGATTSSNKQHKLNLVKKGSIRCGRCKYHNNENAGRTPRTDKYKNKGRQTIRGN